MASTDRILEVSIGSDEVTIELDNLPDEPADIIAMLEEGTSDAWVWRTLAAEYWAKKMLDRAQECLEAGMSMFERDRRHDQLEAMLAMRASLLLARASEAPKLILKNAKQDVLDRETKDKYFWWDEATQSIGRIRSTPSPHASAREQRQSDVQALSRGVVQLANGLIDAAAKTFDSILARQPHNVVALVGKARVLYVRRSHRESLKLFQRALALSPNMLPDPRIGIGLCAWALNDHDRAKKAWERSKEVHPKLPAPRILLALSLLNDARDKNKSPKERAKQYTEGITGLAAIFREEGKFCAAVANPLSDYFLVRKDWVRAVKAAERTIQFADVKGIYSDGYLRLGRIAHLRGDYREAVEHYVTALEISDKNYLARAGLGQMHILTNEVAAAIHDFELLSSEKPDLIEALLPLASLHASSRPGMNEAEERTERVKARQLFERAARLINARLDVPQLGEEPDMWVEVAKLWQNEDLPKTRDAYEKAVRLAREGTVSEKGMDPKLLNALAVVRQLHGGAEGRVEARALFEEAMSWALKAPDDGDKEVMETTILYNLARCYELSGEQTLAQDAYEKLLKRHPEYVDAKMRLAHMLDVQGRVGLANQLIKDALESQGRNLNLRAFYTHFLLHHQENREFWLAATRLIKVTNSQIDKHDVYTLCAIGLVLYQNARDNKHSGPEALQQRRKDFRDSAGAYEKALSLDPTCAIAAMGLAIIVAEDALGTLSGVVLPGVDVGVEAERNAAEALSVFSRIREFNSDGSVFINMGHCHFTLQQYDKAIENYEAASIRYYSNQNADVLNYLMRAYYSKANREQSPESMQTALDYAQKAAAILPHDKAISYNIAIIQQKAAELLFSLPPERRTLVQLQDAITQAGHAQTMFASLVDDTSASLPISRDIADQRRRYGDNMLRRANEHIEAQKQHEQENMAKAEAARQMREEQRRIIAEAEEARKAELQRQAAELTERRRLARLEAQEWAAKQKAESDEENERKVQRAASRKGKRGPAALSDEEAEPKKKKSKTKVKSEDDEDEALFTGDEAEQPKKIRPKRVIREDDEEEEEAAGRRGRKKIKSKATISDSDEEME